jgi:hypothetical protein
VGAALGTATSDGSSFFVESAAETELVFLNSLSQLLVAGENILDNLAS